MTDHFFGWDQDIIICFLYIPPSDSNWFKSGKSFNFDKLREETAQYELMGNVILCGDFNGRIGLNSDVENDEKKEFLSLPKNYEPGNVDLINRKLRDPEHHLKGNLLALLEFFDFVEFCRPFSSSKISQKETSLVTAQKVITLLIIF